MPYQKKALKSLQMTGVYFASKDKMVDIELFVSDVLHALNKKKNTWEKWFDRLSSYYDKRFHGTDWREKENEFWEKRTKIKY